MCKIVFCAIEKYPITFRANLPFYASRNVLHRAKMKFTQNYCV